MQNRWREAAMQGIVFQTQSGNLISYPTGTGNVILK